MTIYLFDNKSYVYLSVEDPLWLNIFQAYKHKDLEEA